MNKRSTIKEQDLINDMLAACSGRNAKLKKISDDLYSVYVYGPVLPGTGDIQYIINDVEYTVDKKLFNKFYKQLKEKNTK